MDIERLNAIDSHTSRTDGPPGSCVMIKTEEYQELKDALKKLMKNNTDLGWSIEYIRNMNSF